MKKYLITSFIAILLFLFVTPAFAAECTSDEIESLEALAEKIEISHEFKGKREGNYLFYLTAHNVSNKFYLEMPNGLDIYPTNTSEFLGSFYNDNKFEVVVHASDKTVCKDQLLLSIEVDLPKFNKYSEREECVDNKELNVCKEWADTSEITEERFKEIIAKEETITSPLEDPSLFDIITQNWKKILIGLILVALVLGIVKYIRNKKRIKIDI